MKASSSTPVQAENNSRPLVFLVDDEAMLLELNTVILEPLGYRVKAFSDPVAAVRAYSVTEPRPALIVTDYAMGEVNGMYVISACRRLNPSQKIILLSGTVDETIFEEASEKPDRFLAKPYQCQQLTDLVSELLAA